MQEKLGKLISNPHADLSNLLYYLKKLEMILQLKQTKNNVGY